MADIPKSVEIADQGILISWQDGHNSVYPHRSLRLRCQCAHCIDEWTKKPVLDPETIAWNVKAVDHMVIGNYAIQFLWSDVHYTGIYPYSFLRSNCGCTDCLDKNSPK
jgi:DUF971 family protein